MTALEEDVRSVAGLPTAAEYVGQAFIYARVSPKPKPGETSVDDQIRGGHEDASRDGFRVVGVYADRRISATKANKPRPDFQRMLRDLAILRPGDRIYVWAPDRFIRRPIELERLYPILNRRGITVHAREAGSYDLSTDDGMMNARMYGAIAARETALKSARVRLRLDGFVREGKSTGGGRAFGFQSGNALLHEEPSPEMPEGEAGVIRDVVRRFLTGTVGIQGLANDLNARGIPTPRGRMWTNSTLRYVLSNPRIAGIRTTTDRVLDDDGNVSRGERRELREAAWAPIISVADFRRVEAVLAGRRRTRGREARLLTGFLICGNPGCGARLVASRRAKQHGGERIYTCNRRSTLERGCFGNSVLAEPLEERLIPAFLEYARGWKAPEVTPQVEEANAALEEIAATRASIGRLLARRKMSEDAYEAAEEDLEEQERRAHAVLRAAVDATSTSLRDLFDGDLDENWQAWEEEGNVTAQRAALTVFLESVTILPHDPRARGWNPERICPPRYRGQDCQEEDAPA